jgi:hypothetical protein
MDRPKDAALLGTNLWDARQAGRIMRAPNGVYTPLDGSGQNRLAPTAHGLLFRSRARIPNSGGIGRSADVPTRRLGQRDVLAPRRRAPGHR